MHIYGVRGVHWWNSFFRHNIHIPVLSWGLFIQNICNSPLATCIFIFVFAEHYPVLHHVTAEYLSTVYILQRLCTGPVDSYDEIPHPRPHPGIHPPDSVIQHLPTSLFSLFRTPLHKQPTITLYSLLYLHPSE